MNPKVDAFLRRSRKWQAESEKLREILLDCPLTEELKWGQPCYTYQGKNVVLIGGFKEYCSLLFFKGALLRDPKGILATAGQTQAGRLIRLTSLQEIVSIERVLKTYIHEAIEVEKAGLKVKLKPHSDYVVPGELQTKLDENPALKTAFQALTPGRQRAYMLHISAPKLPKTRESRVEKCIPQILVGKGLND
ncbi:MAG: YdeI/OmpD-associated family protein [Terracidiphilus sp.]|nr:YdeI/OmpD-associated family protein [Terracidiphilus sp.]